MHTYYFTLYTLHNTFLTSLHKYDLIVFLYVKVHGCHLFSTALTSDNWVHGHQIFEIPRGLRLKANIHYRSPQLGSIQCADNSTYDKHLSEFHSERLFIINIKFQVFNFLYKCVLFGNLFSAVLSLLSQSV